MANLYDMLLTRREVLRVGACSLAGYWFLPLIEPANVQAQAKVTPRNSARFVIFVNLDGGQSHVDAWDLKEHKWTPQNFEIKEIQPGVKWPTSLYPNLANVHLAFGFKAEAIRYLRRGLMIDPGSAAMQRELRELGTLARPSLAFLPRRHPVNRVIGRLRRWWTSDEPEAIQQSA